MGIAPSFHFVATTNACASFQTRCVEPTCVPAIYCVLTRDQIFFSKDCCNLRSNTFYSNMFQMSPLQTSVALTIRLKRFAMQLNFRSCIPIFLRSINFQRQKEFCCTDRPVVEKLSLLKLSQTVLLNVLQQKLAMIRGVRISSISKVLNS